MSDIFRARMKSRNDGIEVRPAPTPKRDLTPEECAEIDRRREALRPRPMTQPEKEKVDAIRRCS